MDRAEPRNVSRNPGASCPVGFAMWELTFLTTSGSLFVSHLDLSRISRDTRHPDLKWLPRLANANVISQVGSYETPKMAIATRYLQDIQQDWSVGIGWANERT